MVAHHQLIEIQRVIVAWVEAAQKTHRNNATKNQIQNRRGLGRVNDKSA